MSKAEERALKAYPIVMSQYSDNCKEYDSNESDRLTFIEGYLQAEKDLANAREETIKEVCEWLNDHTILSEKWYIEDLKKHFLTI